MQIEIRRNHTTRLYTLGEILINDLRTSYTVEDTLSMLPAGTYPVRLTKGNKRRRLIAILRTGDNQGTVGGKLYHFEPCGTYISSRKNHSVCIGQPIMPGALKKGAEVFERLFDRIEKAEARNEDITLIITDGSLTHSEPIKFWDEPASHGCPPSKRRVVLNEDDSVDIYEGDHHIRHLSVEDQRALREA